MKNTEETTKLLINNAKPNEEEISSSKLILEAQPEVLEPRSNLKLGQSDVTINNTKEVSESASSGPDKSSKSR